MRTKGEVIISRGAQADPLSLEGESKTIAHIKHARKPDETLTNAEHIAATWNASKDLTTPQAVAYLELGPEMEEELKWRCDRCYAANEQICDRSAHDHNCKTAKLLTLLAKLDKLKEVE